MTGPLSRHWRLQEMVYPNDSGTNLIHYRGFQPEFRPDVRVKTSQISYKKAFELRFSGNKVYDTACSLLVILKNSCSKLHCQRVLSLKASHTKSLPSGRLGEGRSDFSSNAAGCLRGLRGGQPLSSECGTHSAVRAKVWP